ncbi:uncharacterized protein BDZ99DRAFT_560399 [Mytilinidion resinicola]|uniref:Xylanolytic transcriptional activator regulatory domain-containing protein n=1 Tax=Mytilinidion resinicola TaxID=574789 RepID=A0A6A6YV66_9PEZI|nr:uncharacterized protein BDZ99DRAFT_560399 [Mytilinidion resinicola]KAF2811865.1 hypothetical protein BDZ99DRAFT_560399 [Mytilinidion resinicola]
MKWVSERVGASDFAASASTLSLDVTRNLKMDRKISQQRVPDPDPATAWRYTQAYFEESLDKVFGVVHRPMFEARLQAHFQQENIEEDSAWYALRNTVYASGCKIVHTKEDRPNAFVEAQEKAWSYFENALSVHTDLIYMRTGLSAVQALLAMAFYTEGLGNPALEYMLVSNTLRLAQSKGLHRQPVETWNMREPEIQHRNWLFWAIYAYEKHIAYRSGRPSAIDDDDISSEIPTAVLAGSAINFDFFICVIKHAQIGSSIARELCSVKASKQTPDVIIQKAHEVERRLREWKDSIPPHLRPDLPFNQAYLPPGTHLYHIIYLHFAFYGSLIAIHSVFTYPWNVNGFTRNPTPAVREQINTSTQTVVDASRKIILATKYIDANGSWPTWLTFFYPLLGLINLFIYVLKFPNQPSAPADIALMDVVAGHFGFLEFASNSKIAFPFTGEITSLARATVKKARERVVGGPEQQMDPPAPMTLMAEPQLQQGGVESLYSMGEVRPNTSSSHNEMFNQPDNFSFLQFGGLDSMDIGLENWPSFLPSFSRVSSMAMNGLLGDEELDFIPMN